MNSIDSSTAELLRWLLFPDPDVRNRAIAELAPGISSWESVYKGARSHGLVPQFYSWITAAGSTVPAGIVERARREFELNAFHCLANAAELVALLRVFQESGIEAMPFKGVVLGATAYGDMMARTAGDLDVLIHYRDLLNATAILKDRGYELKTKTLQDGSPEAENYFEYHFDRPADGMVVELRWRLELIQPRYRQILGMEWIWPRRRTAKLAGAEVPNLDAETTLLVLCMHGSKHVWSRLMWIGDVARLIESEPRLNWDFALKEARRVGLWRSVGLGVLLAKRLAGATPPSSVVRGFESDRTVRRLVGALQKQVIDQPGKIPDGRVPYNLQILDFRDRAAVIFSPAILRPSARDRAAVKLPRRLEALYFLIRPFRILWDRSGR